MKRYEIEKDDILDCYIVWEVHRNYKIDRFRAETEKECEEWVERKKK